MLGLAASLVSAATVHAQADSAYLVLASQARVRAQAAPTAPELARVAVGTVVRPTRGAPDQGRATRWTAVTLADGRRGWISTDLLLPFDPAHPLAGYLDLLDRRLAHEGGSFAEWSRLTSLAETAVRLAPAGSNDAGRAALLRLLALQKSLDALVREKHSVATYDANKTDPWLRRYASLIAFSEPAGEWFVDADRLWKLRDEHAAHPIAERIAWAAATQPIPGECEGDPDCDLAVQERTNARYLALYPQGPHAARALGQLAETLRWAMKSLNDWPFCRTGDQGGVTPQRIRSIRQTVARATGASRAPALAALDSLSAHCPAARPSH